jgi:hypothetical protein
MTRIRLGFAFGERARNHLKDLADQTGLSQNHVLEALIVGSGATEGGRKAVAAGDAILQADRAERITKGRSLEKLTKALSADEIDAMTTEDIDNLRKQIRGSSTS